MLVFEYVLILLAAICLSNVVNRFLPVLSVPIVQIALGALITLLPLGFRLELDPDLFFVLFVAPLIFYVSMTADKKTMWTQRNPILNTGVLLVFATVVSVGYLMNLLIPSIPLAAAFALIGALGPTDDVAVASVSKRVNIPHKIKSILEGESIINDASGIVSFQFAMVAMLTGSFSLVDAAGRFFMVALGGVAVGLALTWLKFILVRWVRSLGMENVTLYLLLGILTPFLIYLVAEGLHVSGILAIFAAGIAHSFNKDKFNPDRINHVVASESVWSMLTFTLEGLVFVILGTQLPKILATINQNNYPIGSWGIIACVFLITLLFLVLRFVWSIATIRKKNFFEAEHAVSRVRAGVIFSLSGARGAVTLASVMSIPFLMSNGEAFPERDLIILIAGGVIVLSLLITSFVLPLCVEKKADANLSTDNEARQDILQNVITELHNRSTPKNKAATTIITANYHTRIAELQQKQLHHRIDRQEERKWRLTVCEWEKENITTMLERGETDENTAFHYLYNIENRIDRLSKPGFRFNKNRKRVMRQYNLLFVSRKNLTVLRAKIFVLMKTNTHVILEKLRQLSQTDNSAVIRKIMTEYEFSLSLYQRGFRRGKPDDEMLTIVASQAFQTERDNIQAMLETGRISRETAKEMRHNISLLEVQLKKDYI